MTLPTPSSATPGSMIRPSVRVRWNPGPHTSGARARIGITIRLATSDTTTAWRTAETLDEAATSGMPASSAPTLAVRGRTTEASGWDTIQTSDVIDTVTAYTPVSETPK